MNEKRCGYVVLLLLMIGCGSSQPPSQPSPAPGSNAPTNFRIVPQDLFWEVHLAWEPPAASIAGYTVEASVPGSVAWTVLNQQLLSPSQHSAVVTFDFNNAPELVTIDFRVGGVLSGTPTGYTDAVGQEFGLSPPLGIYAFDSGNGMTVRWTNFSKQSQQVVVERQTIYPPIAADGWTVVANLPPETTEWIDTLAPEASAVEYRVHAVRGSVASDFSVMTDPQPRAALSPTDFVAQGDAAGIRLDWTNHSRLSTEIVVLRAPGTFPDPSTFVELAHLPPDATTYLDHPPVPGGYAYRLDLRGPKLAPNSEGAYVLALQPPAHDPPFQASILDTGRMGDESVVDAFGRWITCLQLGVIVPPGGYSGTTSNGSGAWAAPCAVPGPGDSIDGVDIERFNDGTQSLMHYAYDGTNWSSEAITSGSLGLAAATEARDAQGHLLVAWIDVAGQVWFAQRGTTGWSAEPVTHVLTQFPTLRMALDGTGTPHLSIRDGDRLFHAARPAGGWALEQLTTEPTAAAPYLYDSWIVPLGGTDLLILFPGIPSGASAAQVLSLTRTNGVWTGPTPVGEIYPYNRYVTTGSTPDGSRAAYLLAAPDQLLLREWRSGAWVETALEPEVGPGEVGFDRDGGLHVLVPTGGGVWGRLDASP